MSNAPATEPIHEVDIGSHKSVNVCHRPRRLCLICGVPTHERYSVLIGLLDSESKHEARLLNLTADLAICSRHFPAEVRELRQRLMAMPKVREAIQKHSTVEEP